MECLGSDGLRVVHHLSVFGLSRFATLASIVVFTGVERAELKVAIVLIAVNTKPTEDNETIKNTLFPATARAMVKENRTGIVLEGK
jgi:hypothetical protein